MYKSVVSFAIMKRLAFLLGVRLILTNLFIGTFCGTDICTNIDNFPQLETNTFLQASILLTVKGVGVLGCVNECMVQNQCISFSYCMVTRMCYLHHTSSRLEGFPMRREHCVHSKIKLWTKGIYILLTLFWCVVAGFFWWCFLLFYYYLVTDRCP